MAGKERFRCPYQRIAFRITPCLSELGRVGGRLPLTICPKIHPTAYFTSPLAFGSINLFLCGLKNKT